jgi:DNA-binding NtrC family response regulator
MTTTTALFLVEDDALIRDLLEASLTDAGFGVIEVSCGTKALAEFNADPARFRAVITDIRPGPGPDGWAVARRAREHGVVPCIHNGTPEYALKMVEKGFRFVTIASDTRLMAAGAQQVVARMREGAVPQPSAAPSSY